MHATLICQLCFCLLKVMLGVLLSNLMHLSIGLNVLWVHGHWCQGKTMVASQHVESTMKSALQAERATVSTRVCPGVLCFALDPALQGTR